MSAARAALTKLWTGLGHDPATLNHVDLTGAEPVLPSSFAVGTAMQASAAAAALAAASVWRARSGRMQRVGVDMRAAAIAARSERYLTVDGEPPPLWDKIAGIYRCSDGRSVRLHTNFPHHRDGVLAILKCTYDKTTIGQALRNWKAFEFEDVCARPAWWSRRCELSLNAMRTSGPARSRTCRYCRSKRSAKRRHYNDRKANARSPASRCSISRVSSPAPSQR